MLGAVKRPAELIVPPLALQVNVGCVAIARWNWSSPWALNCWVAPAWMLAVPGVTTMLVSVCLTVTVTVNEAVLPLGWACQHVGARHAEGYRRARRCWWRRSGPERPKAAVVAVHVSPASRGDRLAELVDERRRRQLLAGAGDRDAGCP